MSEKEFYVLGVLFVQKILAFLELLWKLLVMLFGINGNVPYLLWHHVIAWTTSPTHCGITMGVDCDIIPLVITNN